jgi:thymidylate synthase
MVPDELIGTLGDVHLYKNHIQQAKEQLTREPMDLPLYEMEKNYMNEILEGSLNYNYIMEGLVIYQSHPPIKAPLSN